VENPSTVRALFPRLDPVNGGTLGARVYSQFRAFLMVGGVPPGEKITLRELTRACGTSLMPVREVVQCLAAKARSYPIARSGSHG
jgi:DNA-binding GntR family transcriptional regulator